MNQPRHGLVMTYSGIMLDPLNPDPALIDPIDIAHHLSNICRYTGAPKRFYSVAEHCCLIYDLICRETDDEETRKWAVLHDGDEYAMMDMAAPIKHHPSGFAEPFRKIAQGILEAIADRFDLSLPESPRVKELDLEIRKLEKYVLLPHHPVYNNHPYDELPKIAIQNWSPYVAKFELLDRFMDCGVNV